ncbi:MAG: small multi-drug export protein [Candidatus Marinimicrobia bacterium]|nr:small multi-drug export protein [Candidatus Neomarinimicrobiota bacterium]
MWEIAQIIFWTFMPLMELRLSIPLGILKMDMNWMTVFIVAVISNILLGIIIFLLLEGIINIMTKIPFVNKIWLLYVEKTQHKIQKGVEKYGEWAIAVFIGIPLPGSGVYTGALAAFLIGLDERKFFVANIIGVLIAGIVVTVLTLTLDGAHSIFLKAV